MIFLYSGTPGSGKSIHQAMQIYYAVKFGRPVIANFEIDRSMFRNGARTFICKENDELTPEYLEEFARQYFADRKFKEQEIQLYIDECSLMFSAREWNGKDRKAWIRFFQLHRKLGYNVYLVSQMDTMIDKNIRGLVEYEVKHRKLNNVGWVGKLASLVFLGHPVICCVTYWYGQKMRISSEFILGRRRYYRLYDTFKVFG